MADPTDIEQARIDEMLSVYRELQSQFDVVRERLLRAEHQKASVNRRIYDRVRAEYDRQLDALRAKMSPMRAEIDRIHTQLENQLREASGRLESIEEELAEAEFRHRIGEYGENSFDTVRQALDVRIVDARARHDEIRGALGTIASIRTPESPADSASPDVLADAPVVPSPVAAPTPVDTPPVSTPPVVASPVAASTIAAATDAASTIAASTIAASTIAAATDAAPPDTVPRRPVLNAAGLADVRADRFENPQEWIAEMGHDAHRPERRAVPATPATATRQSSEEASAGGGVAAPAAPPRTIPSLVFVRGPHVGQSIALLPTTLTIGREHDNNIEIKDADVARYHARIVHERGNYVVEDLDSSTGTWVNGARARRAPLSHGDVIRVGQTELALDFEWTSDSR